MPILNSYTTENYSLFENELLTAAADKNVQVADRNDRFFFSFVYMAYYNEERGNSCILYSMLCTLY